MIILKRVAAWVFAALIASISASLLSSQQVIFGLTEVGANIGFSNRLAMTMQDLRILETMLPVMCGCFLVGFPVAHLCCRFFQGPPTFWYTLAGASSIVCTLLLMSWFMNLMPVAGARSITGMLLIALSGALGGFIYSRLTVFAKI